MRSKVACLGSFYVQKGAWKSVCRAIECFRLPASPVNTLGVGSQLSKYWDIYWRLIPSLSIGRIYGIFWDSLHIYVHDQIDHMSGDSRASRRGRTRSAECSFELDLQLAACRMPRVETCHHRRDDSERTEARSRS